MRASESATPRAVGFALESGERILWQGGPEGAGLTRRLFRLRWIVAYFALLLAWKCVLIVWLRGLNPQEVFDAGMLAVQGLALAGLIAFVARAIARTTTYTLTDARIVIHHGIALPGSADIPLRAIRSVAVRIDGGSGDVALGVRDSGAAAKLWPHVHGLLRPMPMLRALPDAAIVGPLLCRELDRIGTGLPSETTRPVEAPSRQAEAA